MNLNGFMGDACGHLARKQFRHGRVHGEARASVLLPCSFANQQPSGVNLRGHVRQHELYRLKF